MSIPTTASRTGSARDRYSAAMMQTFAPPLAVLERGEGCRVWDVDGREYLDFLGGIAVNSLGHAHPVFVEAVTRQAGALAHVSNYFATAPQIELAETLRRLTGAGETGRVYFANSGTEANEAAFKLARLNAAGGRHRVLALQNAFHGRTMGALALTGKAAMRAPFEPMPGGVEHLEASIEALEAALDESVAALIVEPIQGEAGVIPLPAGYLERARELTREHGALLIVDEIQTGVGRTGRWFAYQEAGILPDAVTLAKGLGGGFPVGALVTFGEASDLLQKGHHGSTFGGNPLATAVAGAVLAEIERADLLGNARERGAQIVDALTALDSPLIGGVRGAGLLLGIALTRPVAAELAAACLDAGLIVNAANDSSIRLAPPLVVTAADVAEFAERFGRALQTL
ncbi:MULTISPECIES: acetylornithine transaminase [unclassified Rathayibacter]|uniref:acetylornithine transaminase n=1 Tax=unclassified Rathayibacter TaxID=2609250 RepID=UPI000CE87C3B|nr:MULTISPECIES: acetylornithine transaminase [unclassified Rathayibacter]PPF17051.1 acetylornithine transaminase [Rathayibacter sp. AY1A7]PPG63136.1 acetylornithine transaminase [Rathayibacter sp. AY1C7]PPG81977.1 acetylornithine transaminase [Rathayibacter sp. AY1H2]PPG92329.1 acetylornithine transaminase [Rathayibacter sp. AY1F3]PPH50758.1 acetylornithine transaminase [Rathayibacter sp. AY1E1]